MNYEFNTLNCRITLVWLSFVSSWLRDRRRSWSFCSETRW